MGYKLNVMYLGDEDDSDGRDFQDLRYGVVRIVCRHQRHLGAS